MKTIFISLFISSLLVLSLNAHKHNCIHHELNYTVRHLNTSSPTRELSQGRSLQQTYDNIRIYVDYSNLVTGSEAVIEYIKNQLMDSAVAYFEETLKVPRLTSPLIVDGSCGTLNPPAELLTTGVEADLVIMVTAEYNTAADYVAYSIPCSLDWDTNRPTYGMLSINLATLETAQLVSLSDNLYTVLHEMTHLLGFSQNLYQYYIDPSTNELLDNVVGTTTANGQTINYINVEPLTTRVREHFGCDTAPGGYLENDGGSGSAGSHWERRVFYNEYMTANDILDSRVSEFTLALLEGTGWYQVNYNNSEPLQWGQSAGCSFLDGPCMNDVTFEPNFNEFCSPLAAEGCSYTGRAVSVCGTGTAISVDSSLPSSENYWGNDTVVVDSFSDNCPYYIGLPNADCENPADAAFAYLQQEFYGQGSRCFAGTLSPAGFFFAQTVAFCFPVKCNTADDGSNIVTVTVGDNVINCTQEGSVEVSGFTGVLQCPDPDTFCTISNPVYCRVGCSGHGTCVDDVCQCPEGWTGADCSAREYIDSCTRCANETENTSCFGDLCACNPNAENSTCPNSLLIGTGDGTQIDNLSGEAIVNPTGSGANYRHKMNGASKLSTTAAAIASFIAIFFILL